MDPVNVTGADLTATAPTEPAANTNEVVTKDGYVLEKKHFQAGTPAEGFYFWQPKYTNLDVAVKKFGPELVLGLLNTSIANNLRIKAKSELSDADDAAKAKEFNDQLKAKTGGELLSQTDAEAYIPGQREKTSPESLMREAREAAKEGRKDDAKRLFQLAQDAMFKKALELGIAGGDESGVDSPAPAPAGQ